MVCLFTSRIFPTPWGGHTTNSPALRGASFCLTPLPLRALPLPAVFGLAVDGLFLVTVPFLAAAFPAAAFFASD